MSTVRKHMHDDPFNQKLYNIIYIHIGTSHDKFSGPVSSEYIRYAMQYSAYHLTFIYGYLLSIEYLYYFGKYESGICRTRNF